MSTATHLPTPRPDLVPRPASCPPELWSQMEASQSTAELALIAAVFNRDAEAGAETQADAEGCPGWCVEHPKNDNGTDAAGHLGVERSFDGLESDLRVRLELFSDMAEPMVNIENSDLTIAETRALAAHLLNLADTAERQHGATS